MRSTLLSMRDALILGGVVALTAGLWLLQRWLHLRRVFFAALLEQGRRNATHDVPYREDQDVHAIQQRLSRDIGKKRAFSKRWHRKIVREVRK
jgi:hypothetical protein